ncbi:MAG TPA: DPP IV N-terminal domain-containing protein [Candidatus Rubrimentiphilum sp.]|nr:DPP IV N-terminal domain-containing protein [Candidatus Rubrimentiphilum sp.]
MVRRFLVACSLLALFAMAGAPASAQLTLDSVFGATPPWGWQPSRITWAPDGTSFLYVLQSQDPFRPVPIHQYDTRTNQDRVLIDTKAFGTSATPGSLVWSPDSRSLAFTVRGALYVRDMATNTDRLIDRRVSDPQWSPRGGAIAYVKSADLYVATLAAKISIRRMTRGGSEDHILNGGLDWVYPEELSTSHGFAWSPDGKSIAYMQMDERPVTDFPIVDFLANDNAVSTEKYPLAGEKNPRVKLRVVQLANGADSLIYDAGAQDEYLPFIGWRPNSSQLVYELLDRGQTHLRVMVRNAGGSEQALYSQSDPKWVDDVDLPAWLPDGRTLWILDRDGTSGLYLRDTAGNLKRLTGTYRSDSLLQADPNGSAAYITAAYPTRRDRALLAVPINGGDVVNLTPAPGSHSVSLAPGGALFVDAHSTLNDPPQTDLVATADRSVHSTLAARNESLRQDVLPVEMLTVESQFGPLDATMIKPPHFDPSHKYPVIVYVYGGPAAPTTANTFGDQRALYHRLLAQSGFVVFSIDGPASQVDSDANVRLLYHNFGPGSLMGQEIGARYLSSLPYVDPKRIGIWGWSFGGYETAYALTHSGLFKAGAAVAPVTDWHFYDTIYTERYMGKPQDDFKAYDASSVLPAAANLHGDLLISHGTSDDNVHMANSISLMQTFIDADRTNVDFMVYPRRTHSIAGLAQRRHLYGHMLQWWLAHL